MRLVSLAPGFDDQEASEAWAWGAARKLATGCAQPNEWRTRLSDAGIAWCHASTEVPTIDDDTAQLLGEWVRAGGALLLTHLAAPLAQRVGAPGKAPRVERGCTWSDSGDPLWSDDFREWPDYPHIRGFQGWGEHPLFDGLQRGTFTWRPREGERWSRAIYQAPAWPDADVIAVDRAYVQLDASCAVAWEMVFGRGRILCLGANLAFGATDHAFAAQRDRLLLNGIASLDRGRPATTRAHWPRYLRVVGHVVPPVAPLRIAASVPEPAPPTLAVEQDAPDDSPIVLAGRRVLALGTEALGVTELWMHPLCLWSGGVGWRTGERLLRATHVRIEPGVVTRDLIDGYGRRWRERIAVAPDASEFHLELTRSETASDDALQIGEMPELHLPMRLRLQWPIPGDALHPLLAESAHDANGWSLVVASGTSDHVAAIVVNGAEDCRIDHSPTSPLVRLRVAPSTQALRFAVVASSSGSLLLSERVRHAAREGLTACVRRQCERLTTLLGSAVAIGTPSATLDGAWNWALARLTSFLADVPGVGAGLLAGYATTRPGWSDSRPGYAWFFGRDACWCADALLAAGLFDHARMALEFLALTRDVSGKIVHEVTTSGVAHYDAADSTPLWLRLVAAYAEWTGDLATVRGVWDAVRDGFAFVLSTDHDGDGLPENTGVGHGWIEAGSLGGGETTSYTAAIWVDALRRLAPLAHHVGDLDFARRVQDTHGRAKSAFERVLRDRDSGRIALHRRADGSLDATLTALAAVPILLRVDAPRPNRAETRSALDDILHTLSLPTFSTPWGVRLISCESPEYRPRGYHSGAVWPLFTGWVAWAEFVAQHPDRGLEHLLAIARLTTRHAKGAFDEVLDGDTGEAAGVAPDQAWSAAMLIAPLLHGMLGLEPCAPESRCTVAPRWPDAWPEATIRNLRVGSSVFSLRMNRHPAPSHTAAQSSIEYHFELHAGSPLSIHLEHAGAERRQFSLTMAAPVTHRVVLSPSKREGSPDGGR